MIKIGLILVLTLNFVLIECGTAKNSAPPIEISAAQLISDFEKDELSAKDKYAGQSIILSGKRSHFAVLRNTTYVYFKSTDATSKWIIICAIDMDSHPNDHPKIDRGVHGKYLGLIKPDTDKLIISINDCRLAE
jgi:hypothetical protein